MEKLKLLTPRKKSNAVPDDFDFMEILSTEKFMELISGFEILKNFLFDEQSKKTINELISINRISDDLFYYDKYTNNQYIKDQKIMNDIIEMMDRHY